MVSLLSIPCVDKDIDIVLRGFKESNVAIKLALNIRTDRIERLSPTITKSAAFPLSDSIKVVFSKIGGFYIRRR